MSSRRKNINIKNEILSAALEIAREKGWTEVSLRKIASRIDYSTIIIYSHFGSKHLLLLELIDMGFEKLLTRFRQVNSDETDDKLRIHRITNTTIEFFLSNRELYQLMFGIVGMPGFDSEYQCKPGCPKEQLSMFAKDVISKSAEGDVESLFFSWWAMVQGYISIGLSLPNDEFKSFLLPYLEEGIGRLFK